MMRTVVALLFLLVALQCAFSGSAAAQSGPVCITTVNCGVYSLYFSQCSPPIPAGAVSSCQVSGPWTVVCQIQTTNCGVPPNWNPNPCNCNNGQQGSAGNPINLSNGNTYIEENDVTLPGLGGGLTLTRTWNSIWPANESQFQSGMFGLGWRSTYEERVFVGSGDAVNYMVYLRSDGSLWYFGSNGSAWTLASPANVPATLTQNGTQSWTIAFQNGETRTFSYATGLLTAITDRNGNIVQLSYDSSNRLATVTDPASRQLSFTYASNTSSLVTAITSSFGPSWAYSYDTQGRLTQVTEPDQSTFSFQYNSQSLISQVTDSQGKILETHTYDSQGRGLTSSRANGIDAVTVSYGNQ